MSGQKKWSGILLSAAAVAALTASSASAQIGTGGASSILGKIKAMTPAAAGAPASGSAQQVAPAYVDSQQNLQPGSSWQQNLQNAAPTAPPAVNPGGFPGGAGAAGSDATARKLNQLGGYPFGRR